MQAVTTVPMVERADLAEVATGMRPQVAEISDELARVIHRHLHEELDDDLFRATLDSTRANVAQILVLLADGAGPGNTVAPPEALSYAREYVRRGLDLEVLLRAYRAAIHAFEHMWLVALQARLADSGELATTFGAFNDWMFAWVETIERPLTDAYMQERERWVRGAAAMRAEEVRAVLESPHVDLARASRRLNYELDREHVAYVVWARDVDPEAEPDAQELFGDMEALAAEVCEALGGRDHLTVPLGRHLACWAGSRSGLDLTRLPAVLESATAAGLCVAAGAPGRRVEGFRRSHREARLTRAVAKLARPEPGTCLRFDEVALDALLLHDADEARRFVARELGALGADDAATRRLRETLAVFLDERSSFQHAAARLGVHKNTIAYRVRRAEQLLGRPAGVRGLELRVALRLASIGPVAG